MITSTSLLASLLAAAGTVTAIPPESFGFPSAPNDTALGVDFTYSGGSIQIQEAQLLGPDVPASEPTISANTSTYASLQQSDGPYLVLMVDPDASTPQDPSKRFILHWMAGNFSYDATAPATNGAQTLTNSSAPVVPYAQPMPPPTSDPHRYILYLFAQPDSFAVPESFSGYSAENRTNFNLTEFISEADLDEPMAANYFFCSNQSSVPAEFVGAPGSQYPDGNGGAIVSGTVSPSAAVTSGTTAGSGTPLPTQPGSGGIGGPGNGAAAVGADGRALFAAAAAAAVVAGVVGLFGVSAL